MTSPAFTLPAPNSMSLRERISQLVFVRIGSNLPPILTVEQDEERALRQLEGCPVGGLLLFNGGPDTKRSLERLQAASAVPLLVGSDVERGVGQQVKGYTLFPHAMALGRPKAGVASFIESMVHEAREVGIHIVFGPVADVSTNPLNPIISIRAFSEDPDRAAELTTQYVKLAEAAGLLTTAKHFPGHGDTHQDSHDSLPSVGKSLKELRECELVPFQAAVDAGCSLIMTAHVAFPKVDPSGLPATLSRVLLRRVLRDEMGFEGVVCTDSLLMAGVRDQFSSEGEMALAALNAGVDMLLDLREPAQVVEHLLQSVESGALDENRIDEAFGRVYKLKQKVFAEQAETQAEPIAMPVAQAAQVAARDAITVMDSARPALPLCRDKRLVAVLLKPFETPIEPPEQPLGAALRERFRDVTYVQLGPKSEAAAYQSAAELAREAEQVVVAMIIRPAAWHAFGLKPEQSEFVRKFISERGDVVLVSLGVPYALKDYPAAAMRICSYSDVPVSQEALAEFLVTSN